MNFSEFVKSMRAKSLDRPKRTVKAQSRFSIPHEPGSLSRGALEAYAGSNNERAQTSPNTGEVVGLDPSTGEALVRQPGERVVRVQADNASTGNTVSLDNTGGPKALNQFGVKKAGSVTNKSSVTSRGWQPVPGRPGASRLTVTSSRQIEGLDKVTDPCVPPEEKLQIVLAEKARGVGITDKGVVGIIGGGPSGTIALNNQASRDTEAYIQQLYQEIKDKDRQKQTLPQNLSLDQTGGTSPISQQFSASQASLWKCVNNECVQAPDGIFANREQCEANCGIKTYSCVNGTCVLVPGSTGKFKSLGECINAGCNTRYTCIDGSPVPKKDGEFATLEAAIQGGCYWGYGCNTTTGECEPAIGGSFKSLQCCQQSCTAGGFDPDDPFANGDILDLSEYDQPVTYLMTFVETWSDCQFFDLGKYPVSEYVEGPLLNITKTVNTTGSRVTKKYVLNRVNGTRMISFLDNDSDNTCNGSITGFNISIAPQD